VLTPVREAAVERLTVGRELADFQLRATTRILAELGGQGRPAPSYAPAPERQDGSRFTCRRSPPSPTASTGQLGSLLAIYPRNEL